MGSERDWIGDLPEHIITHILSYLPTKDAAVTGLLSKSWRLYWTQVTTIDVEEPNDSEISIQGIQFAEFVKAVLNNLDTEFIRKCRIRLINIYPVWHDALPSILASNNLKVLDMASQSKTRIVLQEVFTMKTLEVVKLGGSFEVKLPDAVCLPRLVDLELNAIEVYESDETVGELISNSPVLESLTIKRTNLRDKLTVCTISSLSLKRLHVCFDPEVEVTIPSTIVRKLKIAAPALEYLALHDTISEQVSISEQTSVIEAGIHLASFCAETNFDDLDRYRTAHHNSTIGVLETLHGVTFLKLSDETMIGLERSRKNLPPNFKRLTKLAVKYDYDQVDSLVDLMDRCVNLQVLEIHWMGQAVTCWGSLISWYPLQYPRCLSLSLKQVTFRSNWRHLEDTLPMLKIILYNSVVVERVNLCFDMIWYYCDKDDVCREEELRRSVLTVLRDRMEKVCKFVSGLHRASPTCEIYTRIGDSGSWDRILH